MANTQKFDTECNACFFLSSLTVPGSSTLNYFLSFLVIPQLILSQILQELPHLVTHPLPYKSSQNHPPLTCFEDCTHDENSENRESLTLSLLFRVELLTRKSGIVKNPQKGGLATKRI